MIRKKAKLLGFLKPREYWFQSKDGKYQTQRRTLIGAVDRPTQAERDKLGDGYSLVMTLPDEPKHEAEQT